ncbi:hypothetical protein [Sphingomonas sp. ID0503]|uniref:hypothetical protein n=1 Tax=Sphingomonas sp. ID0503 TaxID=3399691 RepID=UPI003AFAC690
MRVLIVAAAILSGAGAGTVLGQATVNGLPEPETQNWTAVEDVSEFPERSGPAYPAGPAW